MFAATLFCSKLVAYVFLYWLPYYLNAIPIGGQRLTPQASFKKLQSAAETCLPKQLEAAWHARLLSGSALLTPCVDGRRARQLVYMVEWCVQAAGNLSILFDVGGVLGGALAGSLSDKCGAAASVSAAFVLASVPAMLLYRSYGHLSLGWNVFLMAASSWPQRAAL